MKPQAAQAETIILRYVINRFCGSNDVHGILCEPDRSDVN